MKDKFLSLVGLVVLAAVAILVCSPSARVRAQAIAGYYLTNGQVLIGSTGAGPVAATLTGTSNEIGVTNAAGSITLAIPDTAFGGVPIRTSAQLDTLAAPASGYLAVNITTGQLCISTATAGAWVAMSTGAAGSFGTPATCHTY